MKSMNKKLRSALSVICAAIMCAVMLYVPISVGAERPITQVNFDWGNSASLGDMHTVSVSGNSVAMPGAKPSGTANCAAGFDVSNLIGWKNGDKLFPVGDASVVVADLQGDDGVATLTAVYGEYTNDYNGFTDNFAQPFYTSAVEIANAGGKDGSVGVSLKVYSTNNQDLRQHTFHNVASSKTTTPYYNLGATYKVTFDYKVVDVKGGTVDVNFLFGTVTPNKDKILGTGTTQKWADWAVRNNYVSANKILSVSATSDWKTASAVLTAPDTYELTARSSEYIEENAYGRGMGIGLTGPTDANIIIDNIKIVPVEVVFESGVADIDDIDMTFADDDTLILPEAKTNYSDAYVEKGVLNLFWKNGGKCYKPGETVNKADLIETDGLYKFTAYFGSAEVTFDGLANNEAFYQANKIWYGTGNIVTSENNEISESAEGSSTKIKSHECIDLISGASADNHRNALLFATAGTGADNAFNPETDKAVHFMPGEKYTVTIRYRSYVPADFYVTFGLPAGPSCGDGGVHALIKKTQASNDDSSHKAWHTASATVTAPTADEVTTTRMGISVYLASATTADDQVRIDDITVSPASESKATVNFDFGDGETAGDIITKEYGVTDTIDLTLGGSVANLVGWSFGDKYYSVNESITGSEFEPGAEITLTAVYGTATLDYDNVEAGLKFDNSKYYYGTGAASVAEADSSFGSGNYVKVTTKEKAYRQFLLFDKKNNVHSYPYFTAGEVYRVTLDYARTDALSGDEKIYFAFGVHIGDSSGDSGQTNIKKVPLKTVKAGDSGKIEAFVVAPAAYKWVGIGNKELTSRYMAIGFEGVNAASLKFDNITVEPLTGSTQFGGVVADLGDGTTQVYAGKIGDKISIENPQKGSATFKGWYSDAACSDGNEISAPTKVPTGIKYIYAKFEAVAPSNTVTFDYMPDRLFNPASGVWTTSSCYTIVAGKGVDGSKALRRQLTDGSAGAKPTALNYGQDNMFLESNTVYKVTFSYFIETAGGDLSVSMMAGGANGSWSGSRVFFGENIFLEKTTGKWLEKTFYFATGTLNSKAAYFCVAGGGNSAVSYYDNITVTKIDAPAVALIDYGYDGKQEVITGNVGDALNINIPAPSKDAVLIGYFSDEAYTNKIETLPTALTAGITSVYAHWFIPQKSIITFEDYPKEHLISDAAIGVYTSSTCYSIANGKGVNGSKALVRQLPKSDSQAKPQILSIGGEPVRLASNTTYKITFSYYLETAGTIEAGLLTGGSASNWDGRKIHAQGVSLEKTTGKWLTATFYATTGSISQNCAYLTLAGGGTNTVMYIDNVEISTVSPEETVITFTVPSTGDTQYLVGKKGDPLTLPTVKGDKNSTFTGWFTDKEFTTPYTAKVFPEKHTTVYGNVSLNKTIKVGFDDYPFDTSYGTSAFAGSIGSIPKGLSSDGDGYAVKLDNLTSENKGTEEKGICLNLGKKGLALETGESYVLSYDIYVESGSGVAEYLFKTSQSGNMWGSRADMSPKSQVNFSYLDKGKWYTFYSVGTVVAKSNTCLLFRIALPLDSIVYIDNITVTKLGANEVAAIFASSSGNSPKPVITTKGSSITMPNITGVKNAVLIGWSYVVDDEEITLKTGERFTLKENTVFNSIFTTDNALEDFEKTAYPDGNIVNVKMDHDWEIYDSARSGNSKDNVKSGRYSLHRVGAEPGFKAYQFQRNSYFAGATLVDAETYTISMWVKIEDPVHTKGSIALATAQELGNAWNYMGDPLHIAAIKDVADGEWHQISCVLKAAGPYLTIMVPGNLSIFIDDLYIDHTPDALVTSNVAFEEYIPAFLNEKGEYVVEEEKGKLIDFELFERTEVVTEGKTTIIEKIVNNPVALWLIIAGIAVVVLAAAAVVVLILIKKRKTAKEVK